MANELCVFCGQKPGTFRSTTIQCGGTWQPACKACEKELKDLDEVEVCRRALVRGMAENPDKLRERINLITEADFAGKTMDVYGFVDYYDGTYQLQLFSMDNVTFH